MIDQVLILLCSILIPLTTPQPDPDFHLYILMGQSNMAGRGVITEEYKKESPPRIYMLDSSNQWVPARHPLHFDKPRMAGVGLGLSFGIEMAKADSGARIGLVPCAVGGTPIDLWQPGGFHEQTNTYPYDDALLRIKEAMKAGVIKGILWHQGEGDSNPEKSKIYLDNLTRLIERVRAEVGQSNLPFIAGELGQYKPIYSNINNELLNLPGEVPYTGVVSSEGLTHKGDGTHFDSSSLDEFGRRYALKMMEIVSSMKTKWP